MKERNESLDCLKGIAILLVMFGHVQVHNHMTDPYLYDVIKSIQMPLFFLVSGYLGRKRDENTECRTILCTHEKAGSSLSSSILFLAGAAASDLCAAGIEDGIVSTGLWFVVFNDTVFIYTAGLCSTTDSESVGQRQRNGVLGDLVPGMRCDSGSISGRCDVLKSVHTGNLSPLLHRGIFCWNA